LLVTTFKILQLLGTSSPRPPVVLHTHPKPSAAVGVHVMHRKYVAV